ncbi:MAG TPA: hypothetical protein VMU66_06415, partial [Gaiellales bacterium]|nr:hypothetical protein [Gaiellales bacterium]
KDLSPNPALVVTGQRLDAPAPPLTASVATNGGHAGMGTFMLVGVSIPTPGCWQISGAYHGHSLSFVVWAGPGMAPAATPTP